MIVEQIVASCGKRTGFTQDRVYRALAESWYDAAKAMATMPEATLGFMQVLRKEQKGRLLEDDIVVTTPQITRPLVYALHKHHLLTILHESDAMLTSLISDSDKRTFISGDWLKVFLWQELVRTGLSSDCQWGQRIMDGQEEYLFDVSCTVEDQLYLTLCNVMSDPTAKANIYFDLLDRISNKFLASASVKKCFATFHPQPEALAGYPTFISQAQQRNITIITGHNLLDAGKILFL
jgi:hypothetical protein